MSGYEALYETAAWLDISSRGKIRVGGDDRLRFLHAMSSNALENLLPGSGTYAFFLNAQGRIQADSRIYVAEEHVLLDTEADSRRTLIEHLEQFVIMDDVSLEDLTDSLAGVALEGPRAEALAAQALGARLPAPAPHSHREAGAVRLLRSSLSGQPGLWLIAAAGRKPELIEKLQAAGAVAGSAEQFDVVRVENGLPRFGSDFFDSNIPQETQQLQALSFTKGCYLGQEIVERVRSRGQVNKLLVSLEIEGRQTPPSGTVVEFEGKPMGRLTSPVYSPRTGKVLGMAILRREASEAGTPLTIAGCPAKVRLPGVEPESQ